MKISKTEFKSIIRECLQELIAEGALDHMVNGLLGERVQQDPRVRVAAGGVMEQVFADTLYNTVPQQGNAGNMLPNGMSLPVGMHMGMLGEAVRAPLPPRDPNYVPQPQQGGPATTWARLAFNSPISNRPGGASRTGGEFLPGAKKGSFE